MNPMVELEAKFDASGLTVAKFEQWAWKRYEDLLRRHLSPEALADDVHDPVADSAFKDVVGVDTFYASPAQGKVIRYRRAVDPTLPHGPPSLTYKQRQAPGNIRDRIEIDLFLAEHKPVTESVHNLLYTLGFSEHFTILKESHIWDFPEIIYTATDADGVSPQTKKAVAHVIVALYDVLHAGTIRRFLEIEVDRDSDIHDNTAEMLLSDWILEAQDKLGVREPLTQSLYEMYAPRNHLFLPETF